MNNGAAVKAYTLLSKKTTALVSLFSTTVLTILLLRIDAEMAGFGGKGLLYLQIAFTRSTFTMVLSAWRSGGVDLLLDSLWLYYIYAASYTVLFSSALAYFSSARRTIVPGVVRISDMAACLLPLAAGVADSIGTTLLYSMFSGRDLSENLILALSLVSSLKWALVMVCLILILKSYFSYRKAMKGGMPKIS